MFQFSRFASTAYVFSCWYPCGWVSPFRHLRIKAYLPAPRSFSQAITSFIACNRQGIHHMLLVTWPYNFDFCCQKSPFSSSKTCEVSHLTRYAVMWISCGCVFQRSFREYSSLHEFKKLNSCWRNQIIADGTVHLKCFPSAILIFDSMNF